MDKDKYIKYLEGRLKHYKGLEKKLSYQAYHDQLTELYNRTYYEEELIRINTRRNYPISIIVIDMNNLKNINDNYGHKIGDLALKTVAKTIKKTIRKDDMCARIGGDEFILLLKKTNEKRTKKLIKKLKVIYLRLENNIPLKITNAIGYIILVTPISFIKLQIPFVDANMYKNKKEIKNIN